MFIVVGVFRFVFYAYFLAMRAAIGAYLVISTCRLHFSKNNNTSFSHLNWIALSLRIWGGNNINFNLLSLNARGLRTLDRRKAFFN